MIIAIYGISGCGKTSLCREIEKSSTRFKIVDGSSLMDELIPGGIYGFKRMNNEEKYRYREFVIREIESRHRNAQYHTIVTGHYAFIKNDGNYEIAWTKADSEVYDYILCIRSTPEKILNQCLNDVQRKRPKFSALKLQEWQDLEYKELENECKTNDIAFSLLKAPDIHNRLVEFYKALSQYYITEFCKRLMHDSNKSYSIFDCDGTLFSGDCLDFLTLNDVIDKEKVRSIFEKRRNYCFESFFEIAQYYSKIPSVKMQEFVNRVANSIVLDDTILSTLQEHGRNRNIIWITSGFPDIWEIVADRYNLNVKVLGGNNLSKSDTIVSNEEKACLVRTFVNLGADVIAFGDSMVDADMLKSAQHAVVVIGKKRREDLLNYLSDHKSLSVMDIRQIKTNEGSQ
ncbi:AAA family ATPase [Methanolobus sp.]|uniref:AAA family ATPase n=1 Tax=Methanolobus sp. TaxID=1874737 RepID=UPI0025E9829C|nr:AAA family ATPase [Methanolobus sp.]